MIPAEAFLSPSSSILFDHLVYLPDRKLHLLVAAFLRRVWDDLPSDHTRLAVEATEKFADGCITADELARLRSTDLLESGEALWTQSGSLDEDLLGLGCECCEWEPRTKEYECRVVGNGQVLDGVRTTVRQPSTTVWRAIRYARDIVAWKAQADDRVAAERSEGEVQAAMFVEIVGPGSAHSQWPQWRTFDVVALARGIHRDQAFDRMPILADALQDAGCENPVILGHCRDMSVAHVRGCWLVDLAMGAK